MSDWLRIKFQLGTQFLGSNPTDLGRAIPFDSGRITAHESEAINVTASQSSPGPVFEGWRGSPANRPKPKHSLEDGAGRQVSEAPDPQPEFRRMAPIRNREMDE